MALKRTLGIIASYDSFVKLTLPVAEYFAKQGYEVIYHLVATKRPIIESQIRQTGLMAPYSLGGIEEICDPKLGLMTVDVLQVSLAGGELSVFLTAFNSYFRNEKFFKRPILITGYVGLVYQGHFDGFLPRASFDVFFVNSEVDFQLFSQYAKKIGRPCAQLILSGLPILDRSKNLAKRIDLQQIKERKGIVFAGQPTAPIDKVSRKFLVEKLIQLADRYPNYDIYLKPRHRKTETSFHEVAFYYEDLLFEIGKSQKVPSNLILTYDPITEIFEKCWLCLSVSSTALFEAYSMGLRIGVLEDIGLSIGLGNYYFLGSGAMTTFPQLLEMKWPDVSSSWMEQHYLADGKNCQRIFEAVDPLVTAQHKSGVIRPLIPHLDLRFSGEISKVFKEKEELESSSLFSRKKIFILLRKYLVLRLMGRSLRMKIIKFFRD